MTPTDRPASRTTDRVARRVVIDIRLDALRSNFSLLRNRVADARIFCVLKSDAYGHGAVACAEALVDADGFAVVHPAEAHQLRDAGIRQPILILQGVASASELRELAGRDCDVVVHEHSQLKMLESARISRSVQVWLKTDTGMGRLGFNTLEVASAGARLMSIPGVELCGVLSHLANADETANPSTSQQIATFRTHLNHFPNLPASLANSAAILAWPEAVFDWVRPGLALFGANPLDIEAPEPLAAVMQVTAPLIARKQMRQGDGIGYGHSYNCPENMPVGFVAIGYGDGLPRMLNDAEVCIAGRLVPVIGRVSMDSIAVDLRGVNAATGDMVTLWGQGLPVERLAQAANTISYELLCGIRGHRRYH